MPLMKHSLLPLCFMLILLLSACTERSSYTSWQMMNLQGQVKSFEENTYETTKESGKWQVGEKKLYGHSKVGFDADGILLYTDIFEKGEGLVVKFKSKIEKGMIVEQAQYDKDGNLESNTVYDNESEDESTSETFDNNGNKIAGSTTYMNQGLITKYMLELYDAGDLVDRIVTIYQHNDQGNLISEKQTYKEEEKSFFYRYEYLEYDEQNNWTKKLVFDSETESEPSGLITRTYEYYRP